MCPTTATIETTILRPLRYARYGHQIQSSNPPFSHPSSRPIQALKTKTADPFLYFQNTNLVSRLLPPRLQSPYRRCNIRTSATIVLAHPTHPPNRHSDNQIRIASGPSKVVTAGAGATSVHLANSRIHTRNTQPTGIPTLLGRARACRHARTCGASTATIVTGRTPRDTEGHKADTVGHGGTQGDTTTRHASPRRDTPLALRPAPRRDTKHTGERAPTEDHHGPTKPDHNRTPQRLHATTPRHTPWQIETQPAAGHYLTRRWAAGHRALGRGTQGVGPRDTGRWAAGHRALGRGTRGGHTTPHLDAPRHDPTTHRRPVERDTGGLRRTRADSGGLGRTATNQHQTNTRPTPPQHDPDQPRRNGRPATTGHGTSTRP